MNTDGAYIEEGARAAYGGIVKDHIGSWIRGFSVMQGLGSVLSEELKGIYHVLKLANRLGYKKFCLESDSEDALALLKNGCSF